MVLVDCLNNQDLRYRSNTLLMWRWETHWQFLAGNGGLPVWTWSSAWESICEDDTVQSRAGDMADNQVHKNVLTKCYKTGRDRYRAMKDIGW